MLLVRCFALFSFLCILTCVVAAFARKRKTFFGKAYILYSSIVAGYVLTEFLNITLLHYSLNFALLKFQSLFWINAGSAFYVFSIAMAEKRHTSLYKIYFIGSFLFSLVSLTTDLVISGIGPYASGYDIVPGKLFMFTVLVFVVMPFVLGVFEICRYLFRERKYSKVASKSALILIGTLISVGIAIMTDAVMPHFLNMDSVYRVGASFSVIQTLFIYVAIHDKYISKVRIEDLNHLIYRSSNNPIILLDTDDKISHCNEAAYEISSQKYSDVYGQSLETVFDLEKWEACIREVNDDNDFNGKIVLLRERRS